MKETETEMTNASKRWLAFYRWMVAGLLPLVLGGLGYWFTDQYKTAAEERQALRGADATLAERLVRQQEANNAAMNAINVELDKRLDIHDTAIARQQVAMENVRTSLDKLETTMSRNQEEILRRLHP